MKPYERYKDSGVAWLGEVPEHWTKLRLKKIFTSINGGIWGNDPDNSLYNIVYCIRVADFDYNNLSISNKNLTKRKFSKNEIEKNCLKKGDLLLEKSGGGEKTFVGRAVLFDLGITAVCSNFINRLIINNRYFSNYVKYLLNFMYTEQIMLLHIKQTTGIQNLDVYSFMDEFVFLPPLPEQQQIADFLDHKCEQIDRAIQQKEKLIALLNERRQIAIQHAVTRGLNPDVKLKDSGVEWIGEIPEHWEVKKLKYACDINPTIRNYKVINKDIEVTFLPMEKVSEDGTINKESRSSYSSVCNGFTYFERGDVIVAKITPCFENGKGALLNEIETLFGFGSTEFHVLRKLPNIDGKYLYYHTKTMSFRSMGEALMTGSAGQKRVPTNFIQNYISVIPPLPEQQQIADHLDAVNQKIDTAISLKKQEVEKLKEYKATLINSAVTGKIKIDNISL